jgi:hypothetical protein
MSTPASDAITDPITHASCDTRSGRAPFSAASSGLSTTARIATPTRLRNRTTRRVAATASVTPRTITWWADTFTSKTRNLVPGKNSATRRVSVPGHTVVAMPYSSTSSPTVTTSDTPVGLPARGRISTFSMTIPKSGANTASTSSSDGHVPQPQSTFACQYRNAATIPMAPWAKLKTPDVVYVTTSPLAAMA